MNPEQIWSVSAVNKAIKETLEGAFLPFWIGGEVGSLVLHGSGHAYFQLKDAKSQIRACFFGGVATCRQLGIANGMIVEAWGNLSAYEVRGEYNFNIRKIRLAGTGELQRRFEEVKNKLAAEGLFNQQRKKPIPLLPKKIGVVSSPSGAAVRDFLQILERRFNAVQVMIYPAAVQGIGAAESVAGGVKFFNRTGAVDVIVITRGGGSMEDLWPFNDEMLARTVAASSIPVISAVGHEIDVTICDFAADLRVPTPSAAAELVIGKAEEITARLEHAVKDLKATVCQRILSCGNRLNKLAGSYVFHEPRRIIEGHNHYLDELDLRLHGAATVAANIYRQRLGISAAALDTLNPVRQLDRGYAMIFQAETGELVTSKCLPAGTDLKIHLADGVLQARSLEAEKIPPTKN